jgi:hypothetical protein
MRTVVGTGLTDNHRRALLATLSYLDELLEKAEEATEDPRSPFSTLVQDLSPAERKRAAAEVREIRSQLVRALDELDIPLPQPRVRASWSIQNSVAFARIALVDAAPKRLNGFGKLDQATTDLVARAEADLDRLLSHATGRIGRGWGFGLHEALDQIGAVLGPLIAAGVLSLNGSYRQAFALLGVAAGLALLTLAAARGILAREADPRKDRELVKSLRVTVEPTVPVLDTHGRELRRYEGESQEILAAIRKDLESLSASPR